MFERLREAIEAVLESATAAGDAGGAAGRMQEAVVDARVAVDEMRARVADTERKLSREREQLEDAERRSKLADGVGDGETVEIADRFAAKHREHVTVLARKLDAQKAEIELAERELAQMREQLKQVRARSLDRGVSEQVESAWRTIESAGGARPDLDSRDLDPRDDLLRSQMDAEAREAKANEQLRQLKKKMGR